MKHPVYIYTSIYIVKIKKNYLKENESDYLTALFHLRGLCRSNIYCVQRLSGMLSRQHFGRGDRKHFKNNILSLSASDSRNTTTA
jgi:hypothetical protein